MTQPNDPTDEADPNRERTQAHRRILGGRTIPILRRH